MNIDISLRRAHEVLDEAAVGGDFEPLDTRIRLLIEQRNKAREACKKATNALESIRRNKKVICHILQRAGVPQGPSTIAGWERNLADAETVTKEAEGKP